MGAMTQEPGDDPTTSKYSCTVQLIRGGGEFQIMRNRDPHQMMFPSFELAGCQDPTDVNGPDDDHEGVTWYLDGARGDCFKIELTRSRAGALDVKKVSWAKIESRALTTEQEE